MEFGDYALEIIVRARLAESHLSTVAPEELNACQQKGRFELGGP